MDRPEILYKYFSAPNATEYAEENLNKSLKQGLIRLTGADEVNDPFENEPMFVDLISREDVYKHFVRAYESSEKVAPHLLEVGQELRQRFPSKFALMKHKSDLYKELKDVIPKRFRCSLRKTAFCCLTARPDSQLMWAHYATSHKGVCIGFRREYVQFPMASVPVKYSPDRVPVKLASYLRDWENSDVDKTIFKILTTKSIDWKYEQEWRFIGVSFKSGNIAKVGDFVDFDRAAIVEIIFGERTEDITKQFIREAVDDLNPSPVFYQACISQTKYGIDISRV